LTKMKNK